VIDELLWGTAKTDDSLWEVETRGGQRTLVLTLAKAVTGSWDFLLKSEARPPPRGAAAHMPHARLCMRRNAGAARVANAAARVRGLRALPGS
jgi:hypothetical protein